MLTTEEVWAEEAVGFLLALLCVGRRNYSRLKPARKARIASGQYGWLDAADLLLTLGMAFIVGAFADLIGLVAAELLAAVWTLLRGHGAADLVSGGVVMGTGWYRIQHLFSTRAEAAVSGIILLGIPALATNVLLEALLAPGGGDHPVAVAAVYIVWYLLFERLVLAAADLELAERRRLDTLHSRAGRHDRLADFLASPWEVGRRPALLRAAGRRSTVPQAELKWVGRAFTFISAPGAAEAEAEVRNTSCPICLEPLRAGEALRELGCGHVFHQEEVDQWLTRCSDTCPMCRAAVLGDVGGQEELPL